MAVLVGAAVIVVSEQSPCRCRGGASATAIARRRHLAAHRVRSETPVADRTTRSTNCAPAPDQTMTNAVSHLCGFADTTNTGVPPGTALKSASTGPGVDTGSGWTYTAGGIQTTTRGAVIRDVSCRCGVDVTTPSVTIEDSDFEVSGLNSYPIQLRHASGVVIDHNDLHGAGAAEPNGCDSGIRDIYGDSQNITVENNNVWYCADPMNIIENGGLIQQNYFHDLAPSTVDNHYQDVQLEPGDGQRLTIQDNTFLNQNSQTAAIILSDDGGGTETNRVINHNLLAGGGYAFYAAGHANFPSRKIIFTNNSISRVYYRSGGYWGPVAYWTPGGGNVWAGNIWDNTGKSVAP